MTTTHTSIATDDGAELWAWRFGPVDADTFVLVHGFSLDHTTWATVADGLVDAGFGVVAVDLRGHGQSTLGTTTATADRFVADLAAVLEQLELSSVHLVGHSLGAVVALAARVDGRLADRVTSVTSIAGTEQAIQNPVMRVGARLFSSRAGVWLLKRQRPGRLMISTWFGKKPSTADLDWIRTLSAACSQKTRASVSEGTGDLDLRPTFSQPGPPTLVMCGRDDTATPLKFSTAIAGAIDGSMLDVIDDAGHMVITEQPGAVVDQLVDFVNSL